jgi:hypothetical protein
MAAGGRIFSATPDNIQQVRLLRTQLATTDPQAYDNAMYAAISQHVGDVPMGSSVRDAVLGSPNNQQFWKEALAGRPGAYRTLNQIVDALDNLSSAGRAVGAGRSTFGRRAEEMASTVAGDPLASLGRVQRQVISSTGREEYLQSRGFLKMGPEVYRALLDPANTDKLMLLREAGKGSRMAARGFATWAATQTLDSLTRKLNSAEGMQLLNKE